MKYKIIFSSILSLCATCSAGLDDQMEKFFDKYNTVKSISSPEVVNSQLGTHFLGGGGEARTNVYDVNPVHISLPKFSAGCGGIDYALGGINIASKEEVKQALKSIATNGVGYAFLLGIETTSPVIASNMKTIQTWANQLNSININSCELATSLVQGAWPKSQRASSYICEHAATTHSLFTDHITAKHGCRDDKDKRQKAFQKIEKENEDFLIEDYNVAWKALKDMNIEPEMKNLFMNITGTIVAKKDQEIKVYPPQWKQAMEILRYGGSLKKAYQIGKDNLSVEIKPLIIQTESSWKFLIKRTLQSIQDKILLENKGVTNSLSDKERDLIATTRFPIGTLLSLMAQYNGKGGLIAVDRYSDLIAFERVLKFAEEVAKETLHKAETMRVIQVDSMNLDKYIKQVNEVIQELHALNMENLQKISTEHQMINYLMKIDKTLRRKERGV
ncbi:MAG: conjugal transfer protein TraH (plasmid) [Candidatus Algichlamydia australiensis]|nr:conjugal transfer protein TraH [Chlamydiales bacterium]